MKPVRILTISAALIAGSTVLAAQDVAPPPAAEFARRVQAHYDAVHDFTADFTQHYRGGMLRQSLTERGHVQIKKPSLMNWTYTSPEKKEIVSDGSKVYIYMPADKQVHVYDLPEGDEASTALLFLSGRGNLVRDFRAALPATQPEGAWQLDLTPKTDQAEFAFLSMIVDPRTLELRALTSTDPQGGVSTFVFTKLKENVGLQPKEFAFKIPRGVEVVR